MKTKLILLLIFLFVAGNGAWASSHWVDVTTEKTLGQDGTAGMYIE